MGVLRVDRDEIERHVAAEGRLGRESVGLLVAMPGSDPDRFAHLVRWVLRDIPGGATTYPTSFGCYTYLRDASAWSAAIDELSSSVREEEGLPNEIEVRVTPPRRAARSWWSAMREGQRRGRRH